MAEWTQEAHDNYWAEYMRDVSRWMDWDKYFILKWINLQEWMAWFWDNRELAMVDYLRNSVKNYMNDWMVEIDWLADHIEYELTFLEKLLSK